MEDEVTLEDESGGRDKETITSTGDSLHRVRLTEVNPRI